MKDDVRTKQLQEELKRFEVAVDKLKQRHTQAIDEIIKGVQKKKLSRLKKELQR